MGREVNGRGRIRPGLDEAAAGSETVLVIGDWGTGSPEMSCRQGHPPRVAGADAFHFLAMTQRPTKLEVIGIDGDRIDSFSIPLDPGT
jgi:hypothetical protein